MVTHSRLANKFDGAAREASKIVTYDDERRKAFEHGVRWTLEQLENDAYCNHHPMASASRNAQFDAWTIKDLKRFIKKMTNQPGPQMADKEEGKE